MYYMLKKIYLKELDNMKIFHSSIILNWMSADTKKEKQQK